MRETVTKSIRRLERRFIPNLRKHPLYTTIKLILLLPIILFVWLVDSVYNLFYNQVISRIRFKRKDRDIVLKSIVDGWTNLAFPNPRVESIATTRAGICAECPSAAFSGGYYMVAVDSKLKKIRGLKCNECGCALSAKVRSLDDRCPLGKW